MGTSTVGRMLLSHNFDVSPDDFPPLNREAFTEVFRAGLSHDAQIQCRQVSHPHWIVEIRFPANTFSPAQIGDLCAKALMAKRRSQHQAGLVPNILVLGGLKSTPTTSSSPEALQPGEWGVDVVETPDGAAFLQQIAWATTISQRPHDTVFKVELKGD
ncbi:MAG: DUF2656 domain-containing protein [Leptolyngbyaceae cyanobacterium]